MRFKPVDLVLISIILASSFYLAYRLTASKRFKTVAVPTATPPPQLQPQLQPAPETLPSYAEPTPTSFNRVSSKALRELESNGAISIDRTPLCLLGFKSSTHAAIFRGDYPNALTSRRANVLGDRFPRCYEVGSKVTMVLFDGGDLDAPFAKTFATATIVEIIETPVRIMTDEIFAGIGMNREEHAKFVKQDSETIVVFDHPRPAENSKTEPFPSIFPGAGIIGKSQLSSIQLIVPDLSIIDVRTPAEFAKGKLDGATNIPVRLDPNIITMSPWVVPRKSLVEKIDYDREHFKRVIANPTRANPPPAPEKLSSAIAALRKKTQIKGPSVVVVGANSSDVRAMAFMLELQKLGIQKIFWYVDQDM